MNGVVVGREREIAEASGFLDEAAERSRGLLLVGEPGIGKTTIWHAVVDEASGRGFDVLQARPSEAEAELAFAVLTDLLARVDDTSSAGFPDRPASRSRARAPPDRERGRPSIPRPSRSPCSACFGAWPVSPAVVVAVDDLQWMDAPSLRALTFAFRRLDDARVGLVATVRAGFELELTRLAERDGNAVERIDLDGLEKRAPRAARLRADRPYAHPSRSSTG